MHADVILKWAREHAHGQWMTEKEFDFLFCDFFSKRQLREIRQILNDNGIVFVKELPAEALETVPASEVSEVSEATKVEDAAVTAAEADDDAFDTEDALQQDQDRGDSAEVSEDTRPFDEQTRLAHEWNLPRSNLSNEVLCQMIQEGNRQARQDLLVNNRNLVLAYVQRYLRSPWCHLSKEDLEQIGLEGMLKAAERYDPKRAKFSTYATFWIRQAIERAMMDEGTMIRVPVHMHEFIRKVTRMDSELDRDGVKDKEKRWRKIAASLNKLDKSVTFAHVQRAFAIRDMFLHYASLDMPVGEDGDTSLGDFMADETEPDVDALLWKEEFRNIMMELLEDLKPREARVLMMRYGLDDGRPKTLEEVGQALGVTRERIRQIESRALRRLQHTVKRSVHYSILKEACHEHPDPHRIENQEPPKRT